MGTILLHNSAEQELAAMQPLPLSVRGDLMAIRSTGAYGQVMASRYNMKDLAPSVFSDRLDEAPLVKDYFE